jgi:hypothetical protein
VPKIQTSSRGDGAASHFRSAYPSFRAAPIMARIPARSASGNLGQASRTRSSSASISFLLLYLLLSSGRASSEVGKEPGIAESHWGLKIPWGVTPVPVRIRPRLIGFRRAIIADQDRRSIPLQHCMLVVILVPIDRPAGLPNFVLAVGRPETSSATAWAALVVRPYKNSAHRWLGL